MDVAPLIMLASLSFVLAAGLILLLDRVPRRPVAQTDQETLETAVMLYRGGVLLDANRAGKDLLRAPGEQTDSWNHLSALLKPRYPGFPDLQGCVHEHECHSISSNDTNASSFVLLEQWDDLARVTLQGSKSQIRTPEASEASLRPDVGRAPYPIWQSDPDSRITWANTAYLRLAEKLGLQDDAAGIPEIFETNVLHASINPTRTAISDSAHSQSHWFDVWTLSENDQGTHYAIDANAIVNAEIAQRNFVQTLTKTFAQLSIGLAIFDRNRQLALFNPALIDLTDLPANFLSSRPNLLTFFDRMRENRMMPEPRNYASWREQIAELVVAASDDRYTETWTLPSGVTYRVVGRPHPDGAIAFLFEDISAEVSLTQRYRADIELGHSALDAVREGLAVFSPSGKLGFCNAAFHDLWQIEPDLTITEYTLKEAISHWRNQSEKTDVWERLRHHVLDLNPRESWEAEIQLATGTPLSLRVVSLSGGFTSVLFEKIQTPRDQSTSIEMMAG